MIRACLLLTTSARLMMPLGLAGCASTTIATWEVRGYAQRDQLVSNVEAARDEQTTAQDQFESTLNRLPALANTGEDAKLAEPESHCHAWQPQLDLGDSLRPTSQRQFDNTRAPDERLSSTTELVAGTMDPVRAALRGQSLSLKDDLNAWAIASLQGTATREQRDIARLVAEMETSIGEANRFIDQRASTGPAGTR